MTRDELLALAGGDTDLGRRLGEALAEIERGHERELAHAFALFDEAPVFMTVLEGAELRATRINRQVREQKPDILGKSLRELYTADNPAVAAVERVYATGVPETIDAQPAYLADGTFADRYYTRRLVPLRDKRGDVRGVLTLGYEVTREVRAKRADLEAERRTQRDLQRLYAVLEETPLVINVLEGPELRLVMMNRRSRELLAGHDWMGTSFYAVVPATNPTLMAAARVYATGIPETFELVSRDMAGYVGRSFSTTIVPIVEDEGKVTRVLVASLETTQQMRTQEVLEAQARDLEAARRQAEEASRAKDDFLAMLGHELRNPLAPIVLTLDLMRARGPDSSEVELLQRQVRHLVRLVDDLLDVSRIARGLVELRRRDVDLASIVNRAFEMTGPLIEKRQQRIISDLAPATVHADPDRLAQVVANLITNAAKYSEIGAPIRIRTERSSGRAQVSVTDEGAGIAPERLSQVFEAFASPDEARSEGGLGLGLSIVKGLVEAHGGTVSVHSEGLGKGSTFVIGLPAVDAPSARPEVTRPRQRLQPFLLAKRILVVDDNRDAALALRKVLEAMGQVVMVAHDGPSALQEAATFEPQIGLLDIGLPGMNGYELAAALRATREVRLFAVTGYGQPRDLERSRAAGFEEHLVKPIDIEQLAALLRRLTG
jgi:signal transduction histidine kinase/CheY-like chemotaxis protein